MAREPVATLRKITENAEAVRQQWDHVFEDCYDLAMPQRQIMHAHTRGQQHTDRSYDSTAIMAVSQFVSRLQSDMTPPFRRWASLEPGPMVPDEAKEEVRQELQKIEDVAWPLMHASNMNTALGEGYYDLAVGTMPLLVQKGSASQPLQFVAAPLPSCYLIRGPHGSVDGLVRKYRLRLDEIQRMWRDAKIPQSMHEANNDEGTAEFDVEEITYKDRDDADGGTSYYDVLAPAAKGSEGDDEGRIVARNYDRFPWVIPRWLVIAGEVYGRGPLIEALPDVRVKNKLAEIELQNAALAVMGVYIGVEDGIPETVNLQPGAIIPVERTGGTQGASLAALERPGDLQFHQLIDETIGNRIRKALFDEDLPEETGAVRSATEIIARIRQLQQRIGGPFSRLHSELIVPLFQLVLDILAEWRLIDFPVRIDSLSVQVTVTSPLAREEDVADLESLVQWIQIMRSITPQLPLLGAKVEEMPQWLAEHMGIDQDLVRSKAERKQGEEMIGRMVGSQMAQGAAPPAEAEGAPAETIPQAA